MSTQVNQEYRAFLGWNILTECAKEERTLTYGELGKFVGCHHRVTRFFLALIQNYCLENKLPPLTILVLNQSGYPGAGFIAWDVDRLEEGKQEVFKKDWSVIENPFSFAVDGTVENQLIDQLVSNPGSSTEIYSRIKVRGVAQSIFRQALLKLYGSACAVCELTFEVALNAAHIIPWTECNESDRLNIKNGLLLCTVHHKLFDAGAFFINDNYTISVNTNNKDYPVVSKYDEILLSKFNGKRISLPSDESKYPSISFLREHRNQYGQD